MPPTLHESLPTDPYALRMWHPIIRGRICDRRGGGGGERMSVSQLWVRARFYPSHPIACRIERIRLPLLCSLSLSNASPSKYISIPSEKIGRWDFCIGALNHQRKEEKRIKETEPKVYIPNFSSQFSRTWVLHSKMIIFDLKIVLKLGFPGCS